MERIPDNEFTVDLEYMPSMDSAWHYWVQPEYDAQRAVWELKIGKKYPRTNNRANDVFDGPKG
jgi:hypothetical protein